MKINKWHIIKWTNNIRSYDFIIWFNIYNSNNGKNIILIRILDQGSNPCRCTNKTLKINV